jgi:endonuclease YncB( thermonuclease family)
MREAMIVWGGWSGHEPEQCAGIVAGMLREEGFQVHLENSREAFTDPALGLSTFLNLPSLAESFDGPRAVIVDGDTIAIGSERIRLWNVDAPESFRPRCDAELVAGLKAKERLAQLLRRERVQSDRQRQDRYRRTLAWARADDRDVGETLIAEGPALP